MKKQINLLDLFSGIGGFSLAAQRAGFEIKKHYASEIDKYAQMIYRRNFNGSIQLGDITKIGNDLGKIDIITGGFPCQAFSIAGKREGFEDTRGTLFFEIERLARFYKPSYMVLENVKGLSSHEKGNTIRIILDKIRGLDYSVQLLLLNTKDFGIPQNRERFFFICTARGKRQPEISGIRERKTEIAFSANCIDANYYKGIDNHGQRTCIKVGEIRTDEGFREFKDGTCGTLRAMDAGGDKVVSIPVLCPDRVEKRQNGRRFKENGDPSFTLTAQDRHGVMIQSPRGYNEGGIKEICPTITKNSFEHNNHVLLSDSGQGRKRELRNVAPPLRAHDGCGHDNYTFENSIIRRLTPKECERLQDYPDDWTKYGKADNSIKVPISDSQRYKCCGNSITVKPVMEIMEEIYKVY